MDYTIKHYQLSNDNYNVACYNGSAHINRTRDKFKVQCVKCLEAIDNMERYGNFNIDDILLIKI